MDIYFEQIVRRRQSTLESIMIIAAYIFAIIIGFAILILSRGLAFPISAGLIFGVWWLSGFYNVEYEYIFTNGELDVDRIIARRKRKRFLTINVKKFDIFEKITNEKYYKYLKDPNIGVKFDACETKNSENTYFTVFTNKAGKRMMLTFSPNERLIEQIRLFKGRY